MIEREFLFESEIFFGISLKKEEKKNNQQINIIRKERKEKRE
jgi:hypothetical protein